MAISMAERRCAMFRPVGGAARVGKGVELTEFFIMSGGVDSSLEPLVELDKDSGGDGGSGISRASSGLDREDVGGVSCADPDMAGTTSSALLVISHTLAGWPSTIFILASCCTGDSGGDKGNVGGELGEMEDGAT